MTTPHKATPEQWAEIESSGQVGTGNWGQPASITHACLLELRDRLAAAEQRISKLEQRPIPGTVELRNSAPAGGLVERVAGAMADSNPGYSKEARAAILAVAKWLDTRGQHGCSLWLREEVERG